MCRWSLTRRGWEWAERGNPVSEADGAVGERCSDFRQGSEGDRRLRELGQDHGVRHDHRGQRPREHRHQLTLAAVSTINCAVACANAALCYLCCSKAPPLLTRYATFYRRKAAKRLLPGALAPPPLLPWSPRPRPPRPPRPPSSPPPPRPPPLWPLNGLYPPGA